MAVFWNFYFNGGTRIILIRPVLKSAGSGGFKMVSNLPEQFFFFISGLAHMCMVLHHNKPAFRSRRTVIQNSGNCSWIQNSENSNFELLSDFEFKLEFFGHQNFLTNIDILHHCAPLFHSCKIWENIPQKGRALILTRPLGITTYRNLFPVFLPSVFTKGYSFWCNVK